MGGYWELVRKVARANREEIEADLDRLRLERAAAQRAVDEIDRRISAFELLVTAAGEDVARGDEERGAPLTLHEAMAEILRGVSGHELRAPDLAREINSRGLYRMRDGRPVEAQQIHARVGNYGHMFERRGTSIGLREADPLG